MGFHICVYTLIKQSAMIFFFPSQDTLLMSFYPRSCIHVPVPVLEFCHQEDSGVHTKLNKNATCTQISQSQVPEQGEKLINLHCLGLAKQEFPFTEFPSLYKHRLVSLTKDTSCEIWKTGVKQQPYFSALMVYMAEWQLAPTYP